MKDDQTLTKILQVLNRIDNKLDKLDDLLNLVKMSQKDTIEQTKTKLLAKSPFRESVYRLCDGTLTVSEIAKGVGKSISQVS